jgi:hypothetical protein
MPMSRKKSQRSLSPKECHTSPPFFSFSVDFVTLSLIPPIALSSLKPGNFSLSLFALSFTPSFLSIFDIASKIYDKLQELGYIKQ